MNVRARVVSIAGVLAAAAALGGVVTPPVGASVHRAVAYQVIDDRQMVRRTDGWSSVDSTAFLGTLTCSSAKGQTLRVRKRAEDGGDLRVQTGPGRGSITVLVGGSVMARASTASSTLGFRRIAFEGAGRVDIRITTAGKTVCVDSARLVLPDVIPGG